MSPVEGLVPIVANLRQPYASVMVWQPVREREPLFSLDAVQKVASTVFPNYQPIHCPIRRRSSRRSPARAWLRS